MTERATAAVARHHALCASDRLGFSYKVDGMTRIDQLLSVDEAGITRIGRVPVLAGVRFDVSFVLDCFDDP